MTERAVFLTGGTGFLGKVVLEELLRRREELALERVYLLIRPRGGRGAAERFALEVAASECLARLPGDWSRHVSVLEGTLDQPGLGLDSAGLTQVRGASHIIHAAASVEFDLPLAQAAQANIETSLNLLELAQRCPGLERLVCVSTAYVTPHRGDDVPIAETLAPLPAPAAELLGRIREGRADEAGWLARSGHPNTYTLTKSIAEHLLVARRGEVPLTIIRPSIISASRAHPFPGWIDSTAGFGAFVLLLGLGHLRAVIGDPAARLDLVPVDDVAARILDACRAAPPSGVRAPAEIRHAVAGPAQSALVEECWDQVHRFFTIHPVGRRPARRYLGPGGARFALAHLLHHRLPIAAASVRSGELRRRARALRTRLQYLNQVFPYFTTRSFAFHSSLPLDPSFEPRAYVAGVCRGIYRHIMGRDEAEWPLAGRRHPGHGGDLRWALGRPNGNAWIRFAAWTATKVLRRSVSQVTVDIPSFEAARRAAPDGARIVLVPNHRSYLDFVLCSYLAFARPDLGIPIPHIAAAIEFGRIPILGRVLTALHAFYLRRGEGREDPELTRRVHELVEQGRTLEFFIEGERSRSREFLEPRRGLLRCLAATGRSFTLLPVALSYDRIPEEAAFARELAGAPKPRMRLGPLFRWIYAAWRGRIDLGRIHIACGTPVRLDAGSDVPAVSQEVIRRLREATVATTYHLEAYLSRHPMNGTDPDALRRAIQERGGRVLASDLRPPGDLDPRIAFTLRQQFVHHLGPEAEAAGGPEPSRAIREPEPVA
jgi:1-acyl-sn-glycerol-3-phosphate acyltransferase